MQNDHITVSDPKATPGSKELSAFGQAALWYAGHGWKVHPLKPNGKAPATPHGYQDATTDQATIRRWWQQAPNANVGIAAAPSGLLILDFDCAKPEYAGDVLLAELVNRHPTVMSATPSGGWHLLYAAPADWVASNATGKLPAAVDVRSSGYIAAPPSIHPNGKPYRWVQGHAPHEMTPSPLPDIVLELLMAQKEPAPAPTPAPTPAPIALDDAELIAKIRASKQGTEFDALMAGDTSMQKNDHSAADSALCRILAFWTQNDAGRILRMFKQSRLYDPDTRRQKHPHYDDYLDLTVRAAISKTGKFYAPGVHQANNNGKDNPHNPHSGFTQAAAPQAGQAAPPQRKDKRSIAISTDLRQMRDTALEVLQAANKPPKLFVSAGQLAEVDWNDAAPKIRAVSRPSLLNHLVDDADWLDGKGQRGAAPPKDAADLLLALPDLPFPRLTGIAQAPLFAPDGTLHTKAGYATAAETWIDHKLHIPDTTPTATALRNAKSLWLDELLCDFPFADDASRAHAIALGLLPFCRAMIDGPTPLHLVDAPLRGSGKGLLVGACTLPALGRPADSQPLSGDEESVRKMLLSVLLEGRAVVNLDNLTRLDSDSLALALTQHTFSDRALGLNVTRSAPIRCVWTATGNNLTMSEDLARRCCFIRLQPTQEDPEHRTGFRHANLLAWAAEHRTDLVWAALVIIRNWIDQGRPTGNATKGSYQSWADVMGGILHAAGIPGFLANEVQIAVAKSPERGAMRIFIAEWWKTHQDKTVFLDDIAPLALPEALNPAAGVPGWQGILEDLLDTKDLRTARRSLGRHLSIWAGRVLEIDVAGAVMLRVGDRTKKGAPWNLEIVR